MNTPLTAPQNPTDLVLRLTGGERDGQLMSVQKEKFLLSSLLPQGEDAEKFRCAIFRGEKGVAFRSYSDLVLCNDTKVSVQWLDKGDVIKLNDQLSVEIYQLGIYRKAAAPTKARQPVQTISVMPELVPGPVLQPSALPSTDAPATTPTQNPSLPSPVHTHASGETPMAIDIVKIPEMPSQKPAASVTTPPETMGSAIDSLTDRLSKLVDVASGSETADAVDDVDNQPPSPSPVAVEPSTTVEPVDESAKRRLALENYFANSGVSLSDVPPSDDSVAPAPQSPIAPVASVVTPQFTPMVPEVPQSPPEQTDGQTDAAIASTKPESTSDGPVFDLDAVLAKIGTKPTSSQTPDTKIESPPVAADPATPTAHVSEAPPVEPAPTTQSLLDSLIKTSPGESVDQSASRSSISSTANLSNDVTPTSVSSIDALSPADSQKPFSNADVNSADQDPQLAIDEAIASASPTPSSDADNGSHADGPDRTDNSNSPNSEQFQSFALLESLGLDTTGLTDIKREIAQRPKSEPQSNELQSGEAPNGLEPPEPTAADPLSAEPAETQSPADTPVDPPQPVQSESVADVLARMKAAVSFEDDQPEASGLTSATQKAEAEVAIAPPIAPPRQESPTPVAPQTANGDEEDGSVEDYMSQLLNRMRGDQEPTTVEAANEIKSTPSTPPAVDTGTPTVDPEVIETLTQEEFVPQQKAVRMQSLDSLRAIANSSAREAFRDSVARERKVTTQTKLKIALISLAFAVLFFALSYLMQEKVNLGGVVCGIGFLIIGILTARTYLTERKLDESIISD